MKLRVGFSTTNTLVSKIIRWFTNSTVSHTYVRFHDDFLDADLVMHSDWPGVIIEHAELFDKQNIVIEEFEIDDPRLKSSLRKNLALLRTKYDYWNIAGWAWVITFRRWAHRKIKNPVDNPSKLICVDFVLYVLNRAGITDLPYGQYTPKTLRKWMNENHEDRGWKKDTHENT